MADASAPPSAAEGVSKPYLDVMTIASTNPSAAPTASGASPSKSSKGDADSAATPTAGGDARTPSGAGAASGGDAVDAAANDVDAPVVDPVAVPELGHTGLKPRLSDEQPRLFYPTGTRSNTLRSTIRASLQAPVRAYVAKHGASTMPAATSSLPRSTSAARASNPASPGRPRTRGPPTTGLVFLARPRSPAKKDPYAHVAPRTEVGPGKRPEPGQAEVAASLVRQLREGNQKLTHFKC